MKATRSAKNGRNLWHKGKFCFVGFGITCIYIYDRENATFFEQMSRCFQNRTFSPGCRAIGKQHDRLGVAVRWAGQHALVAAGMLTQDHTRAWHDLQPHPECTNRYPPIVAHTHARALTPHLRPTTGSTARTAAPSAAPAAPAPTRLGASAPVPDAPRGGCDVRAAPGGGRWPAPTSRSLRWRSTRATAPATLDGRARSCLWLAVSARSANSPHRNAGPRPTASARPPRT